MGVGEKGELEESGQKVQISSYKIISSRDVMYNMITVANTAVCYTGKLLRD